MLLNKIYSYALEQGINKILIEVVNHRTDLFQDPLNGFYGKRGFNTIGTAPCDKEHNCDESKLTRPSHFILLEQYI